MDFAGCIPSSHFDSALIFCLIYSHLGRDIFLPASQEGLNTLNLQKALNLEKESDQMGLVDGKTNFWDEMRALTKLLSLSQYLYIISLFLIFVSAFNEEPFGLKLLAE